MREMILNDVGGLSPHDSETGITEDVNIPYVTPQQFGALADGVHDDTGAIHRAIAAANNGYVLFPEGVYRVTPLLVKGTSSQV